MSSRIRLWPVKVTALDFCKLPVPLTSGRPVNVRDDSRKAEDGCMTGSSNPSALCDYWLTLLFIHPQSLCKKICSEI